MKNLHTLHTRIFEWLSRMVSTEAFFTIWLAVTLGWMSFQFILPKPFDDPRAFFPGTVLIYTLVGMWIENMMKVNQAKQQKRADEQDEKLRHLVELMHTQLKVMTSMLDRAEDRDERADEKDEQLRSLMEMNITTVNKILDAIEDRGSEKP